MESSDNDWILKYPRHVLSNNHETTEVWVTKRGRKLKKTKTVKLAPLITMGNEVVYKP